MELACATVQAFKEAVKRCPQRSSANKQRRKRTTEKGDVLAQLRGDAIWNDDIESSEEETGEEQSVVLPDPEPVDLDQEEREEEEERAAKLAAVGRFVLPGSHFMYEIAPVPAAESLPTINARFETNP